MSESEGDKSFMSMLNNPFINPGPQIPVQEKEVSSGKLEPCVFPQVEEAKALLSSASQDQYLTSESDEPFEWINTANKLERLPKTEKELVQVGLLDKERGEPIKIKSLDTFFKENQGLESILDAFKKIVDNEEECKVYLIGEGSITVLILCSVKDKKSSKSALVGLRSLLVQT